mmetsp:Transcript_21286/g.48350  ORF Transcript_21286/g.48350 Transcript_21286/m.48350 type:complete len:433 (-) Transcript_21286:558-1856(-)
MSSQPYSHSHPLLHSDAKGPKPSSGPSALPPSPQLAGPSVTHRMKAVSPTTPPVLRVYRIYSPTLSPSPSFLNAPSGGGERDVPCVISSPVRGLGLGHSLELPSTFGQIYVGQEFAAYVGTLNPRTGISKGGNDGGSVKRLHVSTILQSPNGRRFDLTPKKMCVSNLNNSRLHQIEKEVDGRKNYLDQLDVNHVMDMVIKAMLEEEGTYTLKVTVRYGHEKEQIKPMRKFYKFVVARAVELKTTKMVRAKRSRGDDVNTAPPSLFVQIEAVNLTDSFLTIQSVEYISPRNNACLKGKIVNLKQNCDEDNFLLNLFDTSGFMEGGASKKYILEIKILDQDITDDEDDAKQEHEQPIANEMIARGGIAVGDDLGKIKLCWKKSMGEEGRVYTEALHCPPCTISPSSFHPSKAVSAQKKKKLVNQITAILYMARA